LNVAIDLLSGYVECLLLVLAFEAARRARPIYWAAVAGSALVLYARMAQGILPGALGLGPLNLSASALLTLAGLTLAVLVVLADLLFEVVPEAEAEARPPV
jgi:hypothetical protein